MWVGTSEKSNNLLEFLRFLAKKFRLVLIEDMSTANETF